MTKAKKSKRRAVEDPFADARNIEALKEQERAARRELRAKEKAAAEAEERLIAITRAEMEEIYAYARRKRHKWLDAFTDNFPNKQKKIDFLTRLIGMSIVMQDPATQEASKAHTKLNDLSRRVRKAKKDLETYESLRKKSFQRGGE